MHSKDIYWPEDASEEMWGSLSEQLITFDGTDLITHVPWQGTRRHEMRMTSSVQLSRLPHNPVANEWVSPAVTGYDSAVINDIRTALQNNAEMNMLIPIRMFTVEAGLGSRKFDCIHPSDPSHIYTLHGAGVVSKTDKRQYQIDAIASDTTYRRWLESHGKPSERVGSVMISPGGDLSAVLSDTVAGGRPYADMLQKIHQTAFSRDILANRAEVPDIIWHASVRNRDLGMYISKRPITVPLPAIFAIAERMNIDCDMTSLYQQGEVMSPLHDSAAHGGTHLGNIEMAVLPGVYPTYWTDFETLTYLETYATDVYKDTFGTGIFVSPVEAVRLQDVLNFLRCVKPGFELGESVLSRWEDRISAFMYGYFGKDRMYTWLRQVTGDLYEQSAHPAKAISVFSNVLFDYILREFEPIDESGKGYVSDDTEMSDSTDMVLRTVMRVWLAIERGESLF